MKRYPCTMLLLASILLAYCVELAIGAPGRVVTTDRFEFHSDPWANLHHFLYHWAREDEGLGTGRRRVRVPEQSSLAELPDAERSAWLQAVTFYRQSVRRRSLFDTQMLQEKRALVELGGAEWSDALRRVDLSAYANARAGYTAEGHTVLYSTDAGNQDLYGVETFFHEVQHTREVGGAARAELAAAFEAAGIDQPENLWHALIFATAGDFTRSIAEQEGLPEHVPYWIREGFERLQGWRPLVHPVREHWLPVLRGDASREEGFAALVRSFRSP